MSWRDWTPAKADKIKVGDRVVILDGEAPRSGEAYGTVERRLLGGGDFLVETPYGWQRGEGTHWWVNPKGLRRLKTKEDLLAAMAKYGACDDATEFVCEHPSTDAETIGRDALKKHPGWVNWFNMQALRNWKLYDDRLYEANGGCLPFGSGMKNPKVVAVIWQCYREWCRS